MARTVICLANLLSQECIELCIRFCLALYGIQLTPDGSGIQVGSSGSNKAILDRGDQWSVNINLTGKKATGI